MSKKYQLRAVTIKKRAKSNDKLAECNEQWTESNVQQATIKKFNLMILQLPKAFFILQL